MARGVLIQPSFYEAMKVLPNLERLALYDGICEYSLNGKEPEGLSAFANSLFALMRPNIDSANRRYTASVENGKKGGAPKGNQNAKKQPKNNQKTTKKQPKNKQDYDSDLDLDKDFDKECDLENKGATAPPSPKAAKHKHGEYNNVLLTDEELDKLQGEFPRDWQQRIDNLSGYIASTGKAYKSHYATLRTWARRDKQEAKENGRVKDWCDDVRPDDYEKEAEYFRSLMNH